MERPYVLSGLLSWQVHSVKEMLFFNQAFKQQSHLKLVNTAKRFPPPSEALFSRRKSKNTVFSAENSQLAVCFLCRL